MTSSHETLVDASALPAVLEVHGASVSYTPKGGDAVTVTAAAGAETVTWIDREGQQTKRRELPLTISTDAAGDYAGVAEPALRATVTIGGELWNVEQITPLAGSFARLSLVRLEPAGRARAAYRGT